MNSTGPNSTPPNRTTALGRRDFLKTAGAAVAGTHFLGLVANTARAQQFPSRKNILVFITDQERTPMWFPADWADQNLLSTKRLKATGLTFTRAFTAASMCTPSRNTIFTGLFPAQHRSNDTLTEDMQQSLLEHQLDPSLPNLATCLKEAGYDVYYKGKWHMSKRAETAAPGTYVEDDITRYGFDLWDAPDAGGDVKTSNFGGGTANNDQRFVNDAVAFLQNRLAHPSPRPFCLVVSLVNPHDVLSYPSSYNAPADPTTGEPAGGYDTDSNNDGVPDVLEPTVPPLSLPPTVGENLARNNKPTAHQQVLNVLAVGLGPLATNANKQNYLNFYGNLMIKVDRQIGQLLDVFDGGGAAGSQLLRDTVIIRTSDHGEMGMCHGGLRQKAVMAYEEVMRIPLIWSNPDLFPAARTTDAMVSHVDLLPTLCELTGVPNWQSKGFKGVNYSSVILDPAAPPVQDHVLFTFTDIYAGQDQATFPNGVGAPNNRLRAVRTADYKLVQYYAGQDPATVEDEFYDLRPVGGDYDAIQGLPLEMKNLSVWAQTNPTGIPPRPPTLTAEQEAARAQLTALLQQEVNARLQPIPNSTPVPPELKVEVVRYTPDGGTPQARVQVTFVSRYNETYQLQRSTDLIAWEDVPTIQCGNETDPPPTGPVTGNNGPIVLCTDLAGPQAFFRLRWAVIA